MFQHAIRLAKEGPWAALASVPGLEFVMTSNKQVEISHCESGAAREKHQLMISSVPGNEGFGNDYDVQELVIARSPLRAMQLVNKLQDLNTKYKGLKPQHRTSVGAEDPAEGGWHPFKLQWEDAHADTVASRRKVVEHFLKFQSVHTKLYRNVRVMLAFHLAGGADVCEKMLEGNFAVFSELDPGFYGQAIYVTTDIDYAVTAYGRDDKKKIRDKLYIIFCYIVIGNSCPVIELPFVDGEEDKKVGFCGAPLTPKADSHLVVVASDPVANANLGDDRKGHYYPSPPETWGHSVDVQGVGEMVTLLSRAFTEVALRDESQIFPAGYMAIRPTKAKREELEDAPCKSMGSLGRLAHAKNDPVKAMAYFDEAVKLSSTRMRHVLLAERARLHSANGDHTKAAVDLKEAVALRLDWAEGHVQLAIAKGTFNLAMGKPATQSSVYDPGNENKYGRFAKYAVDGDTEDQNESTETGFAMHTNQENQAWWEVDLGTQCVVHEVRVYTRTGCMSRLWPSWLLVSDHQMPTGVGTLDAAKKQATTAVRMTEHQRRANFKMRACGRHVRVQLERKENLHLTQVEVYGHATQSIQYKLAEEELTWEEHEQRAVEWGGHLASIASKEENDKVQQLAVGKQVWLGGKRKGTGNGPTAEHWEWSDGMAWGYCNWAPGEPNNGGGTQDRVQMYGGGDWDDLQKAGKRAAVYMKERKVPAMKLIEQGKTLEDCKNAGYSAAELFSLCDVQRHDWFDLETWGQFGDEAWSASIGKSVIAEGKFGKVTAVGPWGALDRDIIIQYEDGSVNSNHYRGFFSTRDFPGEVCIFLIALLGF
jgi:hypothetical protein